MIEIKPVQSKKDLKQFILLPFRLYRNDPNWVAPLISDQFKFFNPKLNPYYQHSEVQLFLAFQDNKIVGRISAHTNTQHNLEHKDNIGFFGFFECENNQDIADALLTTAIQWNKERGKDIVRGPMNLSVNDECGLLVEGFDYPPFIMMPHHLPYYQDLLINAGFTKVMDMYAYLLENKSIPDDLKRTAELIQKRNRFSIRNPSKAINKRKKEIATILKIYQKAWEYNWGNVPMTEAEFTHIVKQLLPIIDTDLVLIAEVDGQPAGFALGLPNYNEVLKVMHGKINPITILKAYVKKKQIRSGRLITLGVIKEFQNRGIDVMFYYLLFKKGLEKGYKIGELSWVLENNIMTNTIAQRMGGKRYKTYRLFDKVIT